MTALPPTLELVLPRGSVPRLLRHPALGVVPAEGVPVTLGWHDTPDGSLAAQGRALCGFDGGWVLEEIRAAPGGAVPPGSAARVVRSAPSLADLGLAEHGALQQVAVFAGRSYRAAAGLREVEVLDGSLAARGEEHPTCRVRLRGFDGGTVASLAGALPISVPGDALPGFALHCATGAEFAEPARPQVADGSVGALAGVTVAAMGAGIAFWSGRAAERGASDVEAIHQARVAIRRTRSALRLLRPAVACADLEAVETDLRLIFGRLGAVRDVDVFLEWCTNESGPVSLLGDGTAAVLAAARQRRAGAWAALHRHLASPAWRIAGVRLAAFATLRPWAEGDEARRQLLEEDAAAFGQSVLRKARRKLLGTGPPQELSDEELHALRRRCKRLRYAAEVFAPLFPGKPARRFLRRLARVQDAMGRINDMAVAAKLATDLRPGRLFGAGVVAGWAGATGSIARRNLADDWSRLREAEPFWG